MVVFEHTSINYRDLLHQIAAHFQVEMKQDRLEYPPTVATGFAQVIPMQAGGLQALAYEHYFVETFLLKRKRIDQEFYTIWFTDVDVKGDVVVELDAETHHATNASFSTAMLTSSLFDANYELSAGSSIRGINILLDNQWLAQHLGVSSQSGLLQKYLSLKASRITMEPLDMDYKKLLQEIMDLLAGDEPFKQLAIQNRIMLLLERFFMRMSVKMENNAFDIKLSREDINRVMEVESLITKDLFRPAPIIPELAKLVNVSETKLKNNFKTVFGVPIYQYFQKARMRAAREVLETNKYSIKQVALEMGYINLSNFSTAFRKEFGILPSHLNHN
jgi:AraC-like DNA-binding protein